MNLNSTYSLDSYKIAIRPVASPDSRYQRFQFTLLTPDRQRLFGTPDDYIGLKVFADSVPDVTAPAKPIQYPKDVACLYALREASKPWSLLQESIRRHYSSEEIAWAKSREALTLYEQVKHVIDLVFEDQQEFVLVKLTD